jgi:uncharacterized protein (DUF305 family)
MKFRSGVIASSTLALALVLTGCATSEMSGMNHEGTATPSEAAVDGTFNAADEMFVTEMIPHHEQALEMAEMVLAKDGVDERVIAIAERIKEAQQPEIDLMNSWLEAWGLDMGMGDMEGMDHGSGGMMSDEDMAALEAASGADASSLFLEQMIMHHTGAIDMAQQELDNGENVDALKLAQNISDSQTAEIAEMEQLLTEL